MFKQAPNSDHSHDSANKIEQDESDRSVNPEFFWKQENDRAGQDNQRHGAEENNPRAPNQQFRKPGFFLLPFNCKKLSSISQGAQARASKPPGQSGKGGRLMVVPGHLLAIKQNANQHAHAESNAERLIGVLADNLVGGLGRGESAFLKLSLGLFSNFQCC